MKLTIIGTGYVGLVSGACFARMGHRVICHDIDKKKIENLKKGIIPIYEPGLEKIVKKNLGKNLKFTSNIKEAIEFGEIVMSAVGTPIGKGSKADLKYVKEVAKSFAENLNEYKIFVNKSTVPVKSAEICKKIIEKTLKNNTKFDIASNPEFLREGRAVNDTLKPDRIIIGTDSQKAKALMKKLYAPFKANIVFTDIKSAEIIKYAANAFLAMKISFINEIANFCEQAGGNVSLISKGIGLDKRIGEQFLQAGIGYGGSCFPKDVKALIQSGKEFGTDFEIIRAVERVNEKQKLKLVEKFKKHFPKTREKVVGILGLSFKPNTDDLRCAPSMEIIGELLEMGVKVRAYDPIAMKNFKNQYPKLANHKNFRLTKTPYEASKNADALMLVTEWDEFKKLDMTKIAKSMKGNLVLDGRNIFDKKLTKYKTQLEQIGI